jgi:hypothetical protein
MLGPPGAGKSMLAQSLPEPFRHGRRRRLIAAPPGAPGQNSVRRDTL